MPESILPNENIFSFPELGIFLIQHTSNSFIKTSCNVNILVTSSPEDIPQIIPNHCDDLLER